MRCNVLKCFLLLTNLFLVDSLRCFQGHEGTTITVKESGDGFMCAYETMKPCNFKEPLKSANFRTVNFKTESLHKCWGKKERAICYCNEDLCNGNFRTFQQKWSNSGIQNKTLYDCVLQYIAKKSDLPIPPSPKLKLTTFIMDETKAEVTKSKMKTADFPTVSLKPEDVAKETAADRERTTVIQQFDFDKTHKVPMKNSNGGMEMSKEDGDEHSETDRKLPADDESFDRKEADVLMFVIIAIGVIILVCLIIPAAVYVVKNRKTDMKGKTKLKVRKNSTVQTPTSVAKSEGRM